MILMVYELLSLRHDPYGLSSLYSSKIKIMFYNYKTFMNYYIYYNVANEYFNALDHIHDHYDATTNRADISDSEGSFISEEKAIRFYKRAKDIAKQDGAKYTEYRTNQAIGKIFFNSNDFEQAKSYYRQSLVIAMELHDKHCEGTSCLDLASVASEESDYETGREWYEKALYIGTEHDDQILKEKARTGLNIVNSILAKPRNATKRIESTQTVEKMETDKGMYLATNIKILIQFT